MRADRERGVIEMVSRAREAYASRVEEIGLGVIAGLVRRDTAESDREARRLAELQPVVAGIPLLGEGALVEWFDLMLRTEQWGVEAGPGAGQGMGTVWDGENRLRALRDV